MCSEHFLVCVLVLHIASLQGKVINEKELQLSHSTKCTYDYEVTVYTARGAKSTLSDGYQVHALVRYSSVTLLTTNSKCKFSICDVSRKPLGIMNVEAVVCICIYSGEPPKSLN